MKRLRKFLKIATILVLLFFTALYFIAPGMILHPRRVNWDRKPTDFNLPAETVQITAQDSALLKGFWVRHDSVQRPVVILLHGVGNCKERWLPTAEWLWKAGYSTVMMDSRAHGESGGSCCSYGYYEKKDVSLVVDYLLKRDSTQIIGVWGHSLGGAIALQALANDPRIAFGVIESTFSDFRNIVYDYQWRLFKVSSHTFADNAIERAAGEGGFEPDSIKPYKAAARIQQPIFMAHGTEDERISYTYGQYNFEHLSSTDKQFYPVEGAHHNDLHHYGGAAYQEAIYSFLRRVTHPNTGTVSSQ